MLVLTRKPGQTIIIGKDIQVKILSVRSNQVSLGIKAPGDMEIWRDELKKRIDDEKPQFESPTHPAV